MPTVRLPSLLQPFTDGRTAVEVTGTTLRTVIDDLERQHPGLRDRILAGDEFRPDVMIFINSDEAGGLDAAVSDDAEVHILPAIAGGA